MSSGTNKLDGKETVVTHTYVDEDDQALVELGYVVGFSPPFAPSEKPFRVLPVDVHEAHWVSGLSAALDMFDDSYLRSRLRALASP